MTTTSGHPADPAATLLAQYTPIAGVPDEFVADGAIRPVWRQFASYFGQLSRDEIEQRFLRGNQYLQDMGVFYRQYDAKGSVERDWPLSHVPVLIADAEWRQISQGLEQRAELLEAVVADLYGDNRLIANGHLPAELVADNAEWLRPLVGVVPRSGHFLHFIAFEIGRGPGGDWWVLGDRTQAPSGAAFALENRVATSRVFSDLFPVANVHRLAGFFRDFRDALFALQDGPGGSRIGVLTPGPLNDTYYEHAYIARYLGFPLLRGNDLAIGDGRVMVRTVRGLLPVDVLWRRIDSSFIDPLVLSEQSQIGTPGLVEAIRNQAVSMVNMPGSGVLETRALMAFLPRICQELRREPLRLPNIATWWCGQPFERDHVLSKLDEMMVGAALSTRLPFDMDEMAVFGGKSASDSIQSPREWIEKEGARLVGQEAVTLSTTPAFIDGRLEPRPMIIRVFMARTASGWKAMPGGYARIGRAADPTAVAMQRGGSVADVWVIGDKPIQPTTMRPPATAAYTRVQPGVLPSRAAENLFWLGRYSERAEAIIRMARAYNLRLAQSSPDVPLLRHVRSYLGDVGVDIETPVPAALVGYLESAMTCAGEVRDRFSIDGWAAIQDLAKSAKRFAGVVRAGDDSARAMGVLLRKVAGFSGLVHENMYRFSGWRFLTIGRSIEYAAATAAMLGAFTSADAPDGALDLAVEVADSVMSHRRRFAVETDRTTVIDLLALDMRNPRSVLYHLDQIKSHEAFLPGAVDPGAMAPLARAILRAHTALAVETPETLDTSALMQTRADLWRISDLVSETFFE